MQSNVIQTDQLCFSYDKTGPTLQSVCIEIKEKEFIAVFGPNGGGKTTLLKLILGLLKPTRGNIWLLGDSPEKTRHLVGYVPQRIKFDKDFPITTLDVVMMGALHQLTRWGRYPRDTKQLAKQLLDTVGLSHRQEACFGSLSGGEAQRALIARALMAKPQLLILDEPTAHIDDKGEERVYELLAELNKEMTIVMVTHDLQTVVSRVNRLLCVQTQVTSLHASTVCEHFALGLYHTPLTSPSHFATLGPSC